MAHHGLTSNLVKSLTSVHLPPPPGSSSSSTSSRVLSRLDNVNVSPMKRGTKKPEPQPGPEDDDEAQDYTQIICADDGSKPQISYANLIGMAILQSTNKRLTLSQIYKWIGDSYKYYKTCDSGWQNSIRHNLSLNKAFIKRERSKDEPGKGNYWSIQDGFESQFIKAFKHTNKWGNKSGGHRQEKIKNDNNNNNQGIIIDMSSPQRVFVKPESLGTKQSCVVVKQESSDEEEGEGGGATSIFNSCNNVLNEHELLPDYASLKEQNWTSSPNVTTPTNLKRRLIAFDNLSSPEVRKSPPSWLKQLSTPNLTWCASSSSPGHHHVPSTPYNKMNNNHLLGKSSISPTTCLRNHRRMIRNLTDENSNSQSVAKFLIYNNEQQQEEDDDDDPISRACFGSPDKRAAKRLYLDSTYCLDGSSEDITDVFGVDICQVMRRAVNYTAAAADDGAL